MAIWAPDLRSVLHAARQAAEVTDGDPVAVDAAVVCAVAAHHAFSFGTMHTGLDALIPEALQSYRLAASGV